LLRAFVSGCLYLPFFSFLQYASFFFLLGWLVGWDTFFCMHVFRKNKKVYGCVGVVWMSITIFFFFHYRFIYRDSTLHCGRRSWSIAREYLEAWEEAVKHVYVQPLCKSVRDSDFGVRHFSICNSGGPLKKPQEKTFPVTNGARNQ
jgi:hypothetical protein